MNWILYFTFIVIWGKTNVHRANPANQIHLLSYMGKYEKLTIDMWQDDTNIWIKIFVTAVSLFSCSIFLLFTSPSRPCISWLWTHVLNLSSYFGWKFSLQFDQNSSAVSAMAGERRPRGGSRWVVLDQLYHVRYNGLYSIPTMDEIQAFNSHYIGK
jgi:hypothetical protein